MSIWLREYVLPVRDENDPRYRAPHDPACRASDRHMLVHTADGAWGIVDRRIGRLLVGTDGRPRRFVYRNDAEREVDRLNAPRMPQLGAARRP